MIVIFVAQLVILYFLSRASINELFHFFSHVFKNKKVVFSVMSIFFFPGTVLHEMAHFVMAIILFLRVHEISVFPEWQHNAIKLGKVTYEKKDFIRGILVGVAPVIVGLLFFWLIAQGSMHLPKGVLWNGLLIYSMFVVSTTMFSSKQDMIDSIFVLPLIVIGGGVVYIFNIPFLDFVNNTVLPYLTPSITIINTLLFYCVLIHIVLLSLLKSFNIYVRR